MYLKMPRNVKLLRRRIKDHLYKIVEKVSYNFVIG